MNGETIVSLGRRLRAKETTCRALAEEAFRRIGETEGKIHAFLTLTRDEALARADALDAELRAGKDRGPLHGIPVALKDNLCTRGVRTTCGSRILENFVPPYSASAVERLEEAGAVSAGKTNMDEFAMGSSNEWSAFGPTRNPRNPDYAPGGSSGGSAAAVAAGCVPASLGSDTGGSIRQPAALCGVVGVKPTYGRVSRRGLVAFASSLDQIGPFARSVEDAALVLSAISGRDPGDSTSVESERPVMENLEGGVKGMKIGVAAEGRGEGVSPEMRAALEKGIEVLKAAGAETSEVSLPSTAHGIAAYYLVATSEASSNLARYDGARYGRRAEGVSNLEELYVRSRTEGFGPEVKRRIMLGVHALSSGYYDAYYARAQRARRLVAEDFKKAFERFDAVLMPTTPGAAFRLGERTADPLAMYLSDVFTVAANLAGLPALSLPAGLTKERLPLGLQLVGRAFDEATLFRAARAMEKGLAA
jgi:aspartyl-tRNA(Asn)/glutamyl-tRNA(Gln) amidotransferase subunit A